MMKMMEQPTVWDWVDRYNDKVFEILKIKEELEAAARYIEENEVIHKKVKKDIPTVIEYQGRRYILDHANHYK
jgi:hypothetical protein